MKVKSRYILTAYGKQLLIVNTDDMESEEAMNYIRSWALEQPDRHNITLDRISQEQMLSDYLSELGAIYSAQKTREKIENREI